MSFSRQMGKSRMLLGFSSPSNLFLLDIPWASLMGRTSKSISKQLN